MRPKSLALLLLALGCGLVASIGITRVMTRWSGEGEGGETTGIYVAAADVGTGDLLNAQVVKLENWPKDKIPAGAIFKPEDIENRRTRTRLFAGEPILENRLFAKGANQQGATAMIPIGYRVVPVKVDLVSGGSSLILPGDRVDVMIHLEADPNRGIRETITRTILQDIKVFAVNDVLDIEKDKEGGKSITAKTISLLVTPEQAAVVMLAAQKGVVNLVMRSPAEDGKKIPDSEARLDQLLGVAGGSHRENEGAPAQETPVIKEPVAVAVLPAADTSKQNANPTWTMRVVKPNGVDEVVFEKTPDVDAASPFPWKVVAPLGGSAAAPPPKEEPKEVAPLIPEQPETPKQERVSKPGKGNKKNTKESKDV
jgi:pilus assembly protein CpaB